MSASGHGRSKASGEFSQEPAASQRGPVFPECGTRGEAGPENSPVFRRSAPKYYTSGDLIEYRVINLYIGNKITVGNEGPGGHRGPFSRKI